MRLSSTDKIVLYGGVSLIAFSFFAKARALGNLVFSPGNITGMSMSNATPTIDLTILAQNTSTASVTVNSFAGNVFSNGTLIGNVYNFFPVYIPGNSQTPVSVSIALKPLGIVNDLIRAFQYNNFAQNITVEGFANVSGLQLPVTLNFKVGNQNL
jgi:hypothetical protein